MLAPYILRELSYFHFLGNTFGNRLIEHEHYFDTNIIMHAIKRHKLKFIRTAVKTLMRDDGASDNSLVWSRIRATPHLINFPTINLDIFAVHS